MDESKRALRIKLHDALVNVGRKLDAARDPAEMRRLITLRKGLRLMLESAMK
jgi:hypothetical protein